MNDAAEQEALHRAVMAYVEGLHTSDTRLLSRVFLPQARLHAIAAGTVVDIPLAAWLDRVAARPNFKEDGVAAPFEIHTLDVASPTTAFARLTSTVPPARFLDYLTFLKVDGQWRVIDKTYHRYD